MATISEAMATAITLYQVGRLAVAERIFRQVLAADPNQADALHFLGLIAHRMGRHEIAIQYIGRAIELKGDEAAFHSNVGEAFRALGKISEAVACYHRALALKPHYPEALNNLGLALQHQGKLDEAVACYRRALQLKADSAETHSNLGNALRDQGRLDEVVACYRRALALKPSFAGAHNNLGNALKHQGKLDEAVACYRRALELKPDFAEAYNNLGLVLSDQGKLDEALACYERALELKPDDLAALALLIHGRQRLCCWEGLHGLSRRLIEAVDRDAAGGDVSPVTPLSFLALPTVTTAEQQLRCARRWSSRQRKVAGQPSHDATRRRAGNLKPRINVGYLSADFQAHATASLIAELIEKHDRSRYAILGYSYGPDDGSPLRRRLVHAFERFVDLRDMSFAEAARRIAGDEVDILVDLKGYTRDARTEILALRPAPIQVNYLGYPGTLGADFMDYILVDEFVVPPQQQPFFAEKLVHLPGCYQVNDSQREIASRTPSRAECGLPEDGFVFCCFNNSYKITPEVFGVWIELLKAVPGSVLWLLEENRFVPGSLSREAASRGVAAERLVFAPRMPLPEHLARHRLADLFLDTFPVNAHTTASDALWAGCPVLTLAGETFASRVAGSLSRSMGLPELVTTSLDDYQATALRLAHSADLLANLRARLEANRKTSSLFNAERFARNLEQAYNTMWEIYSAGEEPRPFAVGSK